MPELLRWPGSFSTGVDEEVRVLREEKWICCFDADARLESLLLSFMRAKKLKIA